MAAPECGICPGVSSDLKPLKFQKKQAFFGFSNFPSMVIATLDGPSDVTSLKLDRLPKNVLPSKAVFVYWAFIIFS